jgi:hypothetical protein
LNDMKKREIGSELGESVYVTTRLCDIFLMSLISSVNV